MKIHVLKQYICRIRLDCNRVITVVNRPIAERDTVSVYRVHTVSIRADAADVARAVHVYVPQHHVSRPDHRHRPYLALHKPQALKHAVGRVPNRDPGAGGAGSCSRRG